MKKSLLIVFVLFFAVVICSFAENNDFISSLRNCSSYSESGTVDTDGLTVNSTKQIVGWEGSKCIYKETVSFSGINTCVTCKFSKNQIAELANVTQAYETIQKYTNTKVDTSSVDAVKDNPVVKTWNKYLQDQSVCNMSMIR